MKTDTLIIIAAGAVGLYLISKVAKGMTKAPSPASTGQAHTTAVPYASTSGNDTMTLADQYKEYGYGHNVADVYDQTGYLGTTK